MVVGGAVWASHTLPALKEELRKRGLKIGGNKPALVERLLKDDLTSAAITVSAEGGPASTLRTVVGIEEISVAGSVSQRLVCCRRRMPPCLKRKRGKNDISPMLIFGHHKGYTYQQATEASPQYYFWGEQQSKPRVFLTSYLEWVKLNYTEEWTERVLTKRSSGESFYAARGLQLPKKTCDVCESFDMSGANAYVQQKKCLECGDITKEKMNVIQSTPKRRERRTPPSAEAIAEPKRQ